MNVREWLIFGLVAIAYVMIAPLVVLLDRAFRRKRGRP